MQRNAPPPTRSCQRKASPQEQDHRRQNAPDIPCQPMIPSDAPPGYNTPGYAHSPIPLAGDQCPEKHPKSADQADEQPIPPVMRRFVGRCSSTALILDIPHRFNSAYQKPLCRGPSPYSKQGCVAKAAENLAMRQQLAVLNRKIHRLQLYRRDRFFWAILSQLWKNLREVLIIVKPETVIKWHRQGFKLYWRWKSKAPVGRPKIDKEIRELIGKMSRENPLWGVPRIQAELRLLGHDVAESTVAKYRVRGSASPSQTWKTFLANHAKQIAAIDFFTVPTVTFRNLYCFIVLLHDRRKVVHFNVTAH